MRQLIAQAYLDIDPQGHGALLLTEKARPLLRGETELQLRHQAKAEKKTKQKKVKTAAELSACDQPLFEALRTRRLQLAQQQGVPPYVIFHDSTLREMAAERPTNEDTLSRISGVGERKLTRFGKIFIDVIRDYPSSALSKTD